ncbi:unnamed protein product [Owenia fusiformis]|uniref:cardiolipin synthase (CMP-forming) n=1 Tax=Owenia fusiformis TaxID=6347 RepID=A0A8J1U0M2_OWEFU|nr:unnamed protein product [Owenia fusiformis]
MSAPMKSGLQIQKVLFSSFKNTYSEKCIKYTGFQIGYYIKNVKEQLASTNAKGIFVKRFPKNIFSLNTKIKFKPCANSNSAITKYISPWRYLNSVLRNDTRCIYDSCFVDPLLSTSSKPFLRHYSTGSLKDQQSIKDEAIKNTQQKEAYPGDEGRKISGSTIKEKHENIWTIPNLLTVSRVVAAPVLAYLIIDQQYPLATGLFIAAGVTDMLDGQIARRFPSQHSNFGSVLDPLADKIMMTFLVISLTVVDLIPYPLTALIVCRDIGLIIAAHWVRYISLPPPKTFKRFWDVSHPTTEFTPLLISKINTLIQLNLVALSLIAPIFDFVAHPAMQALWGVTAVTTVWSGLGYVFQKEKTFKLINTKTVIAKKPKES